MELYQLKVFLEVARHLSFTEAAEVLNLTQPAVSAKIKALETSLEAELFYRLGRKIELTPIGQYLLDSGPKLVDFENHLLNEIDEIKQGKLSHIRIGCSLAIANGWLPKILFRFRQKYPEIELECLPFETAQQLHQAIAAGDVEIGFSESDLGDAVDVESSPIDRFQYFLMVAADHRLAQCSWLSFKDLTSEFWAFPAVGLPERLVLEERLSELGMQLSDFAHREFVQTSSLLSTFLTQGRYLGFGSSLQLQTERQTKLLKAVPLQEFPLDYQIFLLLPKKISQALQPPSHRRATKRCVTEPLQQFIRLVTEEAERHRLLRKHLGQRPSSPAQSSQPTTFDDSAFPMFRSTIAVRSQPSSSVGRRAKSSNSEPLVVTIGTQNKTIQTVTAGIIIQRLGLLEHFLPRDGRYSKTHYQIRWPDFTSGAPIVAGLQAQELDIGILGDYPLLLSGLASSDASSPIAKTRLVSFVASNPDGTGNTIIVPDHSPLKRLDDLRHRVVAVPFSSSAHGMVMRTLFRADLLDDVTLKSIHNLRIDRLTPRHDPADSYAYFAPLHEIASNHGEYRRLLDSPDLNELPTFHGIVVRDAFADQHPDLVIAYLKALIAAQYWYTTTPTAPSLVSRWVRLSPEIVSKTLNDQTSDQTGLFFPETKIRMDWIIEHVQQLKNIPGNEKLGEINIDDWIQLDFLKAAVDSF